MMSQSLYAAFTILNRKGRREKKMSNGVSKPLCGIHYSEQKKITALATADSRLKASMRHSLF